MKYFYLFLFVPYVMLFASNSYPTIFEQQGTPLFEAVNKFQKLQQIPEMKTAVEHYAVQADKALQMGKAADAAIEKKKKVAYLKVLRTLQKSHDETISLVKKQLAAAMKHNDLDMFVILVESDLDFGSSYFNDEMIAFYMQHSDVLHSAKMDKRVLDQKAAQAVAVQQTRDEDECNIASMQRNLKNIVDESVDFYALVLVSGNDDWLQINDQYFSIIKETPYTIACKYYEDTGMARTYLFPLHKPFTVEAFITRLEAKKYAALIFMLPHSTAKYRQAVLLDDTDLYLKKLTDIMQRESRYIETGPEIHPFVQSSDKHLLGP